MVIFECDKPDGRPCRDMPTRACPMTRAAGCPGELCARFESDDLTPWALDMIRWEREFPTPRA